MSGMKDTIRTAGRLGWAVEANWTKPWLYLMYSIARPIFSSLILVVMYQVIAGRSADRSMFAFLYVGNAFFMYVLNIVAGIGWILHDDREHYEMLKYIYIAPIRMYDYFLGRSLPKLVVTTLAVVVTLAVGEIFLDLNLFAGQIDFLLFAYAFVLGLLAILALGNILAGISLLTARHGFGITESVAGIFYLAAGAIFPIDVLPKWMQAFSLALPLTYWMELLRRAVIGHSAQKALAWLTNTQLTVVFGLMTVALMLVSHLSYKFCEHLARRDGKIDQITNY